MDNNYNSRMSLLKEINQLSQLIGFKIPIDGLLTAAFGKPIIDIVALDNRLQHIYNYDGSMMEFIQEQFGNEAFNILDNNCRL